MGVSIQIVEHLNPLNGFDLGLILPKILDWFLTIFWIIGIVNAFNLIDSMDGLVSGISAWAFGFFIFAALGSQQTDLSNFVAIFIGIILILSFYNTFPAKLFLGDSGAQTLGFVLAGVSIIYAPIYLVQASSWFVPILLFAIPIFDTCLVFVSRMRRHIPFYKGNLDHTYHRLVNSGIDSNRAVFSMQLVALIFDCLAMIAVSMAPIYANLIFLFCVILGAAGIVVLENPKFLVKASSSQS
jgi:UDP-GlcNAc:undecaprenyl-phosphate GlcNAc-1-phosphate transferase